MSEKFIATGYLKRVLAAEERILFAVRRHGIMLFLKTILWILLFTGTAAFGVWMMVADPMNPGYLVVLGLAAIPALMTLWEYLVWHNHIHVMTDRRVLQIKGVFNKDVIDTSIEKLNDVKTRQSLIGRILGFGDIEIVTASDSLINQLRMIARPLEFKRRMLDAKDSLGRDND